MKRLRPALLFAIAAAVMMSAGWIASRNLQELTADLGAWK